MAITGHDSYLPTLDEFLASWALADAAAGGGGISVLDGVDLAAAGGLRGEMAAVREAVRALEMEERFQAAVLRLGRVALTGRLEEFLAVVRAWWAREAVRVALPGLPREGEALERVLRAGRDAVRVWALLDAGAAPSGVALPLGVGPTADFFRADLAALVAECTAARDGVEAAELALKVAREERNRLEGRVREVLGAYARAAAARLGPRHPVVVALPRLYPLPGHTPEAVVAAAVWDAARGVAVVTWEASAEKEVAGYTVRWSPGPRFDSRRARVAGTVKVPAGSGGPGEDQPGEGAAGGEASEEAGAALRLETSAGLLKPGAVATFRVFVQLKSGNERGSVSLTVRR